MKNKTILLMLIAFGILSSACKKTMEVASDELSVEKFSSLSTNSSTSFVSNPRNLNIVMFVPSDNPALPDYKTRLSTLFIYFQNWLHTEMLRYGYDKYMGLSKDDITGLVKFIEIKAAGTQADYPYSSSVSTSKILAEINAYKAAHPTEFSASAHTLILLPERKDGSSDGQPFYGLGKNCFALDNANMAVDKIPNPNSNYLGGMLHELGHGLNLPHNMAKNGVEKTTLGTSLMGAGNVSFSKGQPTFLTEGDAAILSRNQIFQGTVPVSVAYETATTTTNANAFFNISTQSIDLSGTFSSNKAVSDIIIYMDPEVNNEGVGINKDYNAVTWRFTPGANNTIIGKIPLSGLTYKANEPYELKVKLLLQNGNVNTQTYSFDFINGIPQIGANGSAKFYQNGSYGGYEVSLPVGEYKTADLIAKGIKDNDISAVNLGLGVKVILYDGDNFTGSSLELSSSSSYTSTFNDKTSSLKVIAL